MEFKPEEVTTVDYLSGAETSRRRELIFGMVREPAAPYYPHQAAITTLAWRLSQHAWDHGLGRVCVSPVDVVFDAPRALVLQPDLIFVSNDRLSILGDRIWGAPDLVVEVISRGTARRDRVDKLRWYRRYGVREYWILDVAARRIDVVAFRPKRVTRWTCTGARMVRSDVLPGLRLRARDVFEL